MNIRKQKMTLRNKKEIKYQTQQEINFAIQKQQFQNQEIKTETFEFYISKLDSVNLFEIHLGLLGINNALLQNDIDLIQRSNINLLIFVINYIQKDLCPEITKQSLQILKKLSQANQRLLIQNCVIHTLLHSHLIKNTQYFPKIIRIFSQLAIHLETKEIFRQAKIVTMMIDFIQKTSHKSVQYDISNFLIHFVPHSSLSDLELIRNFYEECLISRNDHLQYTSVVGITQLMRMNKLNQLNPQLINSLFQIYKECFCSFNLRIQIVIFFKKCAEQIIYNDVLLQVGLFDFLSKQFEANDISLVEGVQIVKPIISNSTTRANILVSHQVFQSLLQNLQELELFHFLHELIQLIDFEHLHQLIQNGFLRLMAKHLKYQMFKATKNVVKDIRNILEYVIKQGANHFPQNYFWIEIEQLGILASLNLEI